MQSYIKTTLLSAVILCLALFVSGCHKTATATPVSIVGSWSASTNRIQEIAGTHIFIDTTVQVPAGQSIITFDSQGYFLQLSPGHSEGGAYTLYGSTLTLIDTSIAILEKVPVILSSHTLVLRDTSYLNGDTISVNAVTFTR